MHDRPATMKPTSTAEEAHASAADLVFLPAHLWDADVRSELARALALLWTAVHHAAEELHAEFDQLPPRRAIVRWCRYHTAFEEIVSLAELLEVKLEIPEPLWRHAASHRLRAAYEASNDART